MGSLNLFHFHFEFMFGYCLKAAHTDRIPSAVYIEFSGEGWGNSRHLRYLRLARLDDLLIFVCSRPDIRHYFQYTT
jgi:hypothetical protein